MPSLPKGQGRGLLPLLLLVGTHCFRTWVRKRAGSWDRDASSTSIHAVRSPTVARGSLNTGMKTCRRDHAKADAVTITVSLYRPLTTSVSITIRQQGRHHRGIKTSNTNTVRHYQHHHSTINTSEASALASEKQRQRGTGHERQRPPGTVSKSK